MSQPGLGVMIAHLCGSKNNVDDFAGRLILDADIVNDELVLTFADGVRARIYDDGQSCCESRYMRTDDNPKSLIGGTLTGVEAKAGPDEPTEYDCHETMFVEVRTNFGFITLVTHNEHNGYYGGFALKMEALP